MPHSPTFLHEKEPIDLSQTQTHSLAKTPKALVGENAALMDKNNMVQREHEAPAEEAKGGQDAPPSD